MQDDEGRDETPAAQGARLGGQVGSTVGSALGSAVEEVSQRAGVAAAALGEGYGVVRERVATADPGAVVRQWTDVLEGVVEDGRSRALAVLPGRTPPPRRRMPWAVAAAVAGAAGGVAVALAVRRWLGEDAPDAQEPEQLRAVVDPRPDAAPEPPLPSGTTGTVGGLED